MDLLRTKLKLPPSPPDPARISPDIMSLHAIVSARYVGAASLLPMKAPQEGFQKQGKVLGGIREGYKGKVDRVYRLSKDQQAVFQAGLQNYTNFGGHGSGNRRTSSVYCLSPGKTLLAQSCVIQDADTIVKKPDGRSHCQIVTVWQEGADALIEQYKDLVSTLPKAANLEVMVVTKKELMRKFRVKEEAVETTFQINAICKNASRMLPETVVYIYIDECWVTVPKKFSPHLTDVRYKVIS